MSFHIDLISTNISDIDPSKTVMPSEAQQNGLQKRQSIFSLDFATWEALIETFNIKESIIPHRDEEEELQQAGKAGWHN